MLIEMLCQANGTCSSSNSKKEGKTPPKVLLNIRGIIEYMNQRWLQQKCYFPILVLRPYLFFCFINTYIYTLWYNEQDISVVTS